MDGTTITGPAPAAAESAVTAPTPQPAAETNFGTSSGASTQQAPAAEQTAAPAPSMEAAATPTQSAPENGGSSNNAPREIVAGGVKLVIDPATGKRTIVDVKPPAASQGAQQPNQPAYVPGAANPNAIPGNIQKQPEGINKTDTGLTEGFLEKTTKEPEYTENELLNALHEGRVDESRIPELYKPQYKAYKQKRFEEALNAQVPTEDTAEVAKQTAVEANRKFYDRVNQMAKKQAMEQIGITEEELDAAEYTDDKDLINKAQMYEAALQNAQGMILNQTRERIMEQQRAAQNKESEREAIFNDVKSFVANAQQTEPNFGAIDKMLATRYKQMPYEQAQEIAQVINGAQHGQITRRGAEILQKYYEDTRKAFYAQASNVGTVPTHVSRPPAVETPGAGNSSARERPDARQLRNMNYQQKQAWFQKYFSGR